VLVTKLLRNKFNNKISVYIDDKYYASISEKTLIALNIYQNKSISQEQSIEIVQEMLADNLIDKAYKFLTIRNRSEKELEIYIRKKIIENKNIDKSIEFSIIVTRIINYFRERNLVNDAIFAKSWFEYRVRQKKHSTSKILLELKNKGIEQTLLSELLKNNSYEDQQQSNLANLVEKRKQFYSKKHLDSTIIKQKVINYLLQKGYNWSDINKYI
jgi:regulatory protein